MYKFSKHPGYHTRVLGYSSTLVAGYYSMHDITVLKYSEYSSNLDPDSPQYGCYYD